MKMEAAMRSQECVGWAVPSSSDATTLDIVIMGGFGLLSIQVDDFLRSAQAAFAWFRKLLIQKRLFSGISS